MTNLSDTTNSACDLHIPHKQALAALLLGTVNDATGAKWMEENFLEIERWVRFVRLNGCVNGFSTCSGFAWVSELLDVTFNEDAAMADFGDFTFTDPDSYFCNEVAQLDVDGKLEILVAGWYTISAAMDVDTPAEVTIVHLSGTSTANQIADSRYWGDSTSPSFPSYGTVPWEIGSGLYYLEAGDKLFLQGVTSYTGGGRIAAYTTTLSIHRADCGCSGADHPTGGGGPM